MTLVDQYKNLVYKTAHRINRAHGGILSQPDLEAAGMQGLVEAERTWDAERGSLCTWAFFCVRKAIQVEARRQRRAMSENITAKSSDEGSCNLVDTLGAPSEVEDKLNREQLHDLLMSQIRRLPKRQQKLLIKMLARGMTQVEYSAQEGCSSQLVQYHYQDALRRLRGMLQRCGVTSLAGVL